MFLQLKVQVNRDIALSGELAEALRQLSVGLGQLAITTDEGGGALRNATLTDAPVIGSWEIIEPADAWCSVCHAEPGDPCTVSLDTVVPWLHPERGLL